MDVKSRVVTQREFGALVKRAGVTRMQIACECNLHPQTVNAYLLGYCRMPDHIKNRIEQMISERQQRKPGVQIIEKAGGCNAK